MAKSQTEDESQLKDAKRTPEKQDTSKLRLETLVELSEQSFETFCDDISGMFGADMVCNQQQVCTETVNGLKKRFQKLVAVSSVKAEGSLEGTFQLVFDKEALFTLAGVIAMHPEEMILENRRLSSLEKAKNMSELLKQAGDMLVGSWDRVFRKGLDGHGRFVQANTFIGNPWRKSEKKIGLAGDEELVFVPYEMAITPYPAFKCGVIFPKAILAGTSGSVPKQAATAKKAKPAAKKTSGANKRAAKKRPKATAEAKSNVPEEKETRTAKAHKAKHGPVSESIRKIAQSPAALPGESSVSAPAENPALSSSNAALAMPAKDIMQKDVLWCSPDDTVQQVLTRIQQHNAGYMMIGRDGVLEGILSKSDLTGATSPYLRPALAKWRRPLDDATLKIKIKWIMTRPVRTTSPDTPLAAVMEKMCRFGRHALPVTDQQKGVQGLITVFDIFRVLLKSCPGGSTAAKTP